MTAQVLRWFLWGLSFAGVDLLLINAFYARHDTLTPSIIGIVSIGVYIAVVFLARPWLGLLSLMLADSVKQMTHALVTGALLSRRLHGLGGGLWTTLGKISLASLGMIALAGLALMGVDALRLPDGLLNHALRVLIPGAVGLSVYFGLAVLLRVAEARLALSLIRKRLGV
jgi:peptidoglycan biosynthesis protein MviN/MurJ (putative lipid II flippase)